MWYRVSNVIYSNGKSGRIRFLRNTFTLFLFALLISILPLQQDIPATAAPLVQTEVICTLPLKVTDYLDEDWSPDIDGNIAVWVHHDPFQDYRNFEIWVYDLSAGTGPRNISQNPYSDAAPRIDGHYVVWEHRVEQGVLNSQIWAYDLSTDTGPIIITQNNYDNRSPRIDGSIVVWSAFEGDDYEIYVYDLSTGAGPTRITQNTFDDLGPRIDGNYVVWVSAPLDPDDENTEIWAYDLSSGTGPTKISQNPYVDTAPRIDGNFAVWHGKDSNSISKIYLYNLSTGTGPIIISQNSDNNANPQIDGNLVVWETGVWNEPGILSIDIWLYDLSSGTEPTKIGQIGPSSLMYAALPQIDDNLVIWVYNQGGYTPNQAIYVYRVNPPAGPTEIFSQATVPITQYAQVDSGVAIWARRDDYTSDLWITNCDPLPRISYQPDSQTISSGSTATLSVSALGEAPLTYQWYQGAAGDTSIPVGTNSNSFTTPALTSTTSYWVRVSNVYGSVDSETATITVVPPTTFTIQVDSNDDAGGTGCTLREALTIANNTGVTNANGCTLVQGAPSTTYTYIINLPSGDFTYTLSTGSSLEITSNEVVINGDPDSADETIIQAAAAPNTVNYRVFYIEGVSTDVTFNDLIIQHGVCYFNFVCYGNFANSGMGGGFINVEAIVTINNSIIRNNYSSLGGGFFNLDGTVIINSTSITNNTAIYSPSGAAGAGGGFANVGTITVQNNSTISNNTAFDGAGFANNDPGNITVTDSNIIGNQAENEGGGFHNILGIITVTNSNILDNTADKNGGGFANVPGWGEITLNSVTLAGNSATEVGGGFYSGEDGTVNITSATISGNSANIGGGIHNNGTLAVSNSTFTNNSAVSGGGLFNSGSLTVNNSTFSGNSADNFEGGGIYNNASGTLTVNNSTFTNNLAVRGGGIFNNASSTLTVNNSTFSGNSAQHGGGIWNISTLTVNNSTFSGNSAQSFGGGIRNDSTLTVNNSTFSGNSAQYGGGIHNSPPGMATVNNSTLSGNSAGYGGGTYNGGTLHLSNTIMANSTSGSDCYNSGGTISTNENNLIEDNSCSPAFSGDPNLASLQDNGGPTFTHALQSGSLAIDNGNDGSCLTADQRGVARVDSVAGGAICDIGAFEFEGVVAQTCDIDTVGIYRNSDFSWYLRYSNSAGFAETIFNYGLPSDVSIIGDWDGDGYDTVGIRRGDTFYLKNDNGGGAADMTFAFGAPSDIPVAGDWNNDGIDTIGVYRPDSATWFLRNSNSSGDADLAFAYGLPNETPVTGDWNGDGVDTVGIYRDSDFSWYLRNANSAGFAETIINFGLPSDDAVVGDWNGDCVDTVGIYRSNEGNWYLKNTNTTGVADLTFAYGLPNERGVTGHWLPVGMGLTVADAEITPEPTAEPTAELTEELTEEPTAEATEEPVEEATAESTEAPTEEVIEQPTEEPTAGRNLLLVEANDPAVAYSGSWTRYPSEAASGGSYGYSSGAANDTLELTFDGTYAELLVVTHPSLGNMVVEVDGVVLANVSLAQEAALSVPVVVGELAAGIHTLRVYPEAEGMVIAVDAFLIDGVVIVPTPTSTPVPTETFTPAPTDTPTSTHTPEPFTPTPTETPMPVSLPVLENFDELSGWELMGNWQHQVDCGYSGNCVFVSTGLRGNMSTLQYRYPIDLRTVPSNWNVQWLLQHNAMLSAADSLVYEVSTDGGASWQMIGFISDINVTWEPLELDLSGYVGQVINLRISVNTRAALPENMLTVGYWLDEMQITASEPLPTETPIPVDTPNEIPLPAETPVDLMLPTETPLPEIDTTPSLTEEPTQ